MHAGTADGCEQQPHKARDARGRQRGGTTPHSDNAESDNNSGSGAKQEQQPTKTERATDSHKCMHAINVKTNKRDKSAAGDDWGTLRRERMRKARDAQERTVRNAREAQRTLRRGDGASDATDTHKRLKRNARGREGIEYVEREHGGKRRRVLRQTGRDGTGAVPDAVT